MTETQERFVRAILDRVAAERVVEVHVFPPLRQGATETGMAVIAARREGQEAPEPAAPVEADGAPDPADASGDAAEASAPLPEEPEPPAPSEDGGESATDATGEEHPPVPASGEELLADAEEEAGVSAPGTGEDGPPAGGDAGAADADEPLPELPSADDTVAEPQTEEHPPVPADGAALLADAEESALGAGSEPPALEPPALEPPAPEPSAAVRAPAGRTARSRARRGTGRAAGEPGERHTVMTARYRLTIRGPERGKWEFDLVEEADAPLVTVDAVVRGVRERAGEGGDPERLGPDALAAIADASAPWTTARR